MEQIPYNIRVSRRARRMRITVACDGAVAVTLPWGMGESSAERFIQAKSNWILKAKEYLKKFQGRTVIKSGRREYLKHREAARSLATIKVKHWSKIYNFDFKKISIRNSKTRWGSCSKKGNLNFNFKIVHLAEPLLDYLIVHELCHLQEFNHSKKFWALIAQTIPNYKALRKELKSI